MPALCRLALVGALPLPAVINDGFHDIFPLAGVLWVGVQRFADIHGSDRLIASLGRSLPFATRVRSIRVPPGIGGAFLLLGLGRGAVRGLMPVAPPPVVPRNMIPEIAPGIGVAAFPESVRRG